MRYRGVSFFGTLWRDPWLAVQFGISLLTLAGTLLTGYLTYVQSNAEKADSAAHETAFIELVIAFVLSVLTFIKEYHEF